MEDSTMDSINENIARQAREAREASERVYQAARGYATVGRGYAGQVGGRVTHFVEEEPWIAIACAFVVGYAVAQIVKRMS